MAKHKGNQGGRPKGSKSAQTLEKEALRLLVRERVAARLGPITDAQLDAAEGIKHLMLRDPITGKFERMKDQEGIDRALADPGNAVWIFTKDPSTAAYTDLLNRTIDKPTEQIQAEVKGDITIRWEGEK